MEEKSKQILRELFPLKLAELLITNICNDVDNIENNFKYLRAVIASKNKLGIIMYLFYWDESSQGTNFWNKIKKLYISNNNPTEEQIDQIFKEFNIS